MQKVVTHNGGFHSDDVFAVATLQIHFGVENVEVIRTRDEAIIASGDIVVDVGGVYEPEKQRFDHHQVGAPGRENGIPYAAFGLVWKEYGEKVAGSKEAAEVIERRLVMPIDANDNGVSVYQTVRDDVSPATIQDVVSLFKPAWQGDENVDEGFLEACALARTIILRAKMHAEAGVKEAQLAKETYTNSPDKKVIVTDVEFSGHLLVDYPEPLFVVSPDENGNWDATAIRKGFDSYETRVRFPSEWGGLRDKELAKVSGISDAVFCHKAGFLFVAGSKDGVLEAVKKVLGE
ncbi:metal-dependent hydrolase [Candidatus Kaiserbacteria bacterium CG10_big_fil_rev_8_21_14_0_10_44_10]|uniref:Metal-dependent hydrolase n=1 Tax=Candidatus Kaiserbacteria bacterium CG10_big_fil_rev_8_21_14_0_10_44_10 TaxID=1974606 RepID=A0A2H0UHK6_9BACT|nr:MAG: metal-dependent hydrolase [Candidatus Kaiserbacteria bacterium CG10_big_fil_rev_8_21_14_0_10_44_10]